MDDVYNYNRTETHWLHLESKWEHDKITWNSGSPTLSRGLQNTIQNKQKLNEIMNLGTFYNHNANWWPKKKKTNKLMSKIWCIPDVEQNPNNSLLESETVYVFSLLSQHFCFVLIFFKNYCCENQGNIKPLTIYEI